MRNLARGPARPPIVAVSLFAALLLPPPTHAGAQVVPILPDAEILSPSRVVGQYHIVPLQSSPTFVFRGRCFREGEILTHYRTGLTATAGQWSIFSEDEVPFDDPLWSPWQTFADGQDEVTVSFIDLPIHEPGGNLICYLFAVQVMTSDGAVSIDRGYGQEVAHFYVSETLTPELSIEQPQLGFVESGEPDGMTSFEVLGVLEGAFVWTADAESYGGRIESYRWGWDIADDQDPDDQGWALPAGLSDAHRTTGPVPPLAAGVHTLTVQARDDGGALTQTVLVLTVLPAPDPGDQLPLLLVDDVHDRDSFGWPSLTGTPLDRDEYRDHFWLTVLSGPGGVAGFYPAASIIDTEDRTIEPRDLLDYRCVLWTSRWAPAPRSATSLMRPDEVDGSLRRRHDWLAAYQENIGNLLFCGARAADTFLPESTLMLPVVFESAEGDDCGLVDIDGQEIRVAFGAGLDGDPIDPLLHPYRDFGLAAIDIMSPFAPHVAPDGRPMQQRRRRACVAAKGLVLDGDFAADHMPDGAGFPDTVWTETMIDWRDLDAASADDLTARYIWSNDEFYDADIAGRGTPFAARQCLDGPCVEPMLRSISRFDWNRHRHLAADPDDEWPQDYYTVDEIDDGCGDLALNPDRTGTLTNNQVVAFVTHAFLDRKPSGRGDVIMGFDPYRFDHDDAKALLRWVLGGHFGLAMNP